MSYCRARQLSRYVAFTLVAFLMVSTGAMAEALRLPAIFSDHAVLQQKAPIAVWGWGEAGKTVTVSIADKQAETTVGDDGRWSLKLPAMTAGGGSLTLTVTSGEETIALKDILIGEVWLASGQSNMQWSIKLSENWEAEVAQCANDSIRFAMVYREVSTTPLDDLRKLTPWAACTPESMVNCYDGAGFSAVSYYYAKYLQAELGVPVGVINTSWGGTRIEPWTPPVGFAQVPALSEIDAQVRMNTPDSLEHQAALKKAIAEVETWLPNAKEALAEGAFPPALPNVASKSVLSDRQSPTALYNAMVHPLVPYTNRGFIWYQGESNRGEGMRYRDKMEALIKGWRSVWNQDDLACYFVQLAPFRYGDKPRALPEIWEAQTATLKLPHTGMAVINDIGDIKDIHPRNKDDVGKRLALLALNKTYGKTDIVAESPRYDRFAVEGNALRVHFEHAKSLQTRDGAAPTWFTICGPDGVYHDANAVIDGTSVVLTAEGVEKPVAVRYAWDHIAEPNLANEAGLPASAFRAGSVPLEGALRHHVPEAKDFKVVYGFDPTNSTTVNDRIQYGVDNHGNFTGKTIERVAYFMHLVDADENTRWAYVELDPFTQEIARVGVPVPDKAGIFQQEVTNLVFRSNDTALPQGPVSAAGMEFWACNYATQPGRKVPGASDTKYDFDDTPDASRAVGHGSMQFHDVASKTTLMAFNNFRAGRNAAVGIGNSDGDHPDWTFSNSASNWVSGQLLVLVKVAE